MAAASSGSVPAVRALLARGANVNATDKFQNASALMWAAAENHEIILFRFSHFFS